ncbi:MAG: RIP metalloprotease RseP [Candidatus Latescibacterota bacterium]
MITILSFVIALGILVFVHELGHFLVAKWSGIRVERFSVGMPPRMVGFKYGETDYCLSWIPFGGYVKMAGQADVGSDEITGAPWEFPSKSVWTRMAVVAAGPFMNFLFAFVALAFLYAAYGIDTSESTVIDPEENSVAQAVGLLRGDEIVSVDGEKTDNSYRLMEALEGAESGQVQLVVQREGKLFDFTLPAVGEEGYGLRLMLPPTVGQVVQGEPAATVGLLEGDEIVEVDGVAVISWSDMSREIRRHPDRQITLVWERAGVRMQGLITPRSFSEGDSEIGRIGIGPQEGIRHHVGIGRAFELGLLGVYTSSLMILDFLGQLFQGDRSTEELGGPLRIAQMAGETAEQGAKSFISFLAMLSVNLAIINLLPIPVLDGGHLMLFSVEAIMRRPLSVRLQERIQTAGGAIMLFIVALVLFNDLNQMVFHHIVELFQ